MAVAYKSKVWARRRSAKLRKAVAAVLNILKDAEKPRSLIESEAFAAGIDKHFVLPALRQIDAPARRKRPGGEEYFCLPGRETNPDRLETAKHFLRELLAPPRRVSRKKLFDSARVRGFSVPLTYRALRAIGALRDTTDYRGDGAMFYLPDPAEPEPIESSRLTAAKKFLRDELPPGTRKPIEAILRAAQRHGFGVPIVRRAFKALSGRTVAVKLSGHKRAWQLPDEGTPPDAESAIKRLLADGPQFAADVREKCWAWGFGTGLVNIASRTLPLTKSATAYNSRKHVWCLDEHAHRLPTRPNRAIRFLIREMQTDRRYRFRELQPRWTKEGLDDGIMGMAADDLAVQRFRDGWQGPQIWLLSSKALNRWLGLNGFDSAAEAVRRLASWTPDGAELRAQVEIEFGQKDPAIFAEGEPQTGTPSTMVQTETPKRKQPAKRRRRTAEREPSPLTPKQVEAMQLVGEHKGNFSAAGRAAGKSQTAMRKLYFKACRKLGRKAVEQMTHRMPSDRRGQETVTEDRR